MKIKEIKVVHLSTGKDAVRIAEVLHEYNKKSTKRKKIKIIAFDRKINTLSFNKALPEDFMKELKNKHMIKN